MLYFAYGSNLSTVRLRQRVPSAVPVAAGSLSRHRLAFHKIGLDGSAKCDAWYTGKQEDCTLGVVYRIDPGHKLLPDGAEGLGNGYETEKLEIITDPESPLEAFLYTATAIDRNRKPFQWYREHVLLGMREHKFPDRYMALVMAVETTEDHDPVRTANELSIYAGQEHMKYSIGDYR